MVAVGLIFLGMQACETTGAGKGTITEQSLWDNRIGSYSQGQAVAEYGPPTQSRELGNGLREVVWVQNEFYDSSRSAPQTMTVDRFGQSRPETASGVIGFKKRTMTLLFDREGKLRSWQLK
ncbi:MAG: hypothetical protein HC904_11050 [Blastochloris sp.]|nr:hypothetical protein [Blastochloris sp.]